MTETTTVDVNPAASSPATVVDTQIPTSDLTPQERQEWRKSGEKPTRTVNAKSDASSSTPPADSSPAALADPAASTEVSSTPASEPGTSARKKQNAETRKPQLDAEIQARLDRRRQLDQEISDREARLKAPDTVSAPVHTGQDFPEFEEWLAQPGNESKGLGAYTKAAIVFDREQTRQQDALQHEKGSKIERYMARIGEVERDDPDWFSKVAPEILALSAIDQLVPGTPVEMPNVVAQEILESPSPYQVQRYLTDHPDEFRSLLNARTPADVIRKVSAISARLSVTPASKPVPMVKTTTDAPDPPPQIGNRTQSPSHDELLSAATSGDQRRYKETANAIDIARMRSQGRR